MRRLRLLTTLSLCAAAIALGASLRAADEAAGVQVSLCDGASAMTIPGLKPGQVLARAEAEAVAGEMLQVWRRGQGEARWAAWTAEASAARPATAEPQAAPAAAAVADQPTKFSQRDQMLWKREEKKWVDEGYKAFHSWKELGGTIGVSCDMCHPDASNTHPETYPKFQAQIKKVALLRDMINWCIENPMKGKPLPENDPRLRAVEAYILSTRKGVALEAGKH
jgi:thiosulfate dehydrogenase